MKYDIKGTQLPVLICTLEEGQKMIAESGSMSWMSANMKMETSSNGGIKKVLSRAISGEELFQNIYTAENGTGMIAFSSSFPGTIMPIEIDGNEVICQKTSFLAGTEGIDLSIHFRKKIGVGIFGGEGFIMQKISGKGTAFIEIDGSMAQYKLHEGQKMVISTGHLVMMDSTCQIDVETVPGIKNALFGGEGIFNTVVTGPGRIVLQTMPISKTANTLAAYIPFNNSNNSSNDNGISINLFGNK